ncbi:MAG TPA: PKD domain-containing protein [Chitinophagaceae bacterium]|nr:PKD domain-containing protein [Chitinophagaceae bacterium]
MKTGYLKQHIFKTGFLFFFSNIPALLFSQYILNGSASQNNCNCYTLTTAQFTQSGSVWNANKIDLNNSFDFIFNVNLGCLDATGADGIVFILQPISTSIGATGGGMGFEGISPSIGIALDTWENTINNDPPFDHISIQANGNITHGADLAGPVQAWLSSPNIEDCQWHTLRIKWNAASYKMDVFFDKEFRLSLVNNIVANYFNNDPLVYWGFTGATGGAYNLQQFCTSLNPDFTSGTINNAVCNGTAINFSDNSVSFAPVQSWYWDFGDGNSSTAQNPPPHLYSTPGVYETKLVIKGLDGCVSDTLRKNITVGSKPLAAFEVFDTCSGKIPRVNDLSSNTVGLINQRTWLLDGLQVSSFQQPPFSNLAAGTHQLKLAVQSEFGCASDTVSENFIIKPSPVIEMMAPSGCQREPIFFSASQRDNTTIITQWNWSFGDGSNAVLQNPVHTYASAGSKTVKLTATASNGCSSPEMIKAINIAYINLLSLNDTTILPNTPIRLLTTWQSNTTGSINFNWTPATGLSDTQISGPLASIQNDMTYILTATTNEGCVVMDTVNLKVFKGSGIFVPTGFTPNNDGKNDVLRPVYFDITKIHFFRIYNRWGQMVFSSTKPGEGWDGKINGIPQPAGTYVWLLKAEDLAGKLYEMKGISTIIR